MTITSVAGKRKFRVHPEDHTIVQKQEHHGAHWVDYRRCHSWHEASKLVFTLAMKREEITDEMPKVDCHQ